MKNIQIIQALCEIVEAQNAIIRAQADSLNQVGAMCMEEETAAAEEKYNRLLGNTWPGELEGPQMNRKEGQANGTDHVLGL